MIQFSLVTMLELVDQGVLSIERLVELMCHNPARLFEVRQRGFLREGYQADIVLVRPDTDGRSHVPVARRTYTLQWTYRLSAG